MKHINYPKTGQYRNVVKKVKDKATFIGVDENGDGIFDISKTKPVLKFKGTVKLHGCFDKDTLVTLANGEEVPIKEINIGDNVLTYNIETNEYVDGEVYHIENGESDKDWLRLTFDDNSIIECTSDHKFYTKNRGWVKAMDLTSEDKFIEKN